MKFNVDMNLSREICRCETKTMKFFTLLFQINNRNSFFLWNLYSFFYSKLWIDQNYSIIKNKFQTWNYDILKRYRKESQAESERRR